jgi:pyruvate-formate lyase-activating enzyme
MVRRPTRAGPGLAYANARGDILFDEGASPLADGGLLRLPKREELIPAPEGALSTLLPGRRPRLTRGQAKRRTALGVLLPAGYTRLLLPAYTREAAAPVLPLFGYTYACVIDDLLHVAAARTDAREDWQPRRFASGELEIKIARRLRNDPENRILAQLRRCALDFGCFTAQNVFLEQGEAAVPISPKCNAACVGCISEQRPDSGVPAPQNRIRFEVEVDEAARIGIAHLREVEEGIVSFGQGCEGEPLLRSHTIAATIEAIRRIRSNGTINCNTNGSLPSSLRRLIDAGLQAVRISLNSFRPEVYAAYYRPLGYGLDDVLASIRLALEAGLRVSLNLLTHPGVTDDVREIAAMRASLGSRSPSLIQTRTLNIDPEVYFTMVGRPKETVGMLAALDEIRKLGIDVGNFTAPGASCAASIRSAGSG